MDKRVVVRPSRQNQTVDDDLIPPIEYEPPYSLEFVSHLHGSC